MFAAHHATFPGMVNTFVHTIMYAYYFLATFPGLKKYLWWKQHLTKLQLVSLRFQISDCLNLIMELFISLQPSPISHSSIPKIFCLLHKTLHKFQSLFLLILLTYSCCTTTDTKSLQPSPTLWLYDETEIFTFFISLYICCSMFLVILLCIIIFVFLSS